MNIFSALILIFLAGIINGSFALPTKYVKRWQFENIWSQYSLWAFIILPWLAACFLAPQILQVYSAAPLKILLVMIIGGFLFGVGQVCFALALNMIGLGLGFVVNIGLGTALGFFLPLVVQHPQKILTPFGLVTLLGTLFAVLGLIFSTYAGNLRDKDKKAQTTVSSNQRLYLIGVCLAIVAGLFSAGQNFSFSFTSSMQQVAFQMGASRVGAATIMWPGFLISAFIPYIVYMVTLSVKNKSFGNYWKSGTSLYYFFAIIMGLFWYGSLIFYSKASQLIGSFGPIVGWPLFMVLIILTSNFWGWRHKEWEGSSIRAKRTLWVGLSFLILAVLVLGYSSGFHT